MGVKDGGKGLGGGVGIRMRGGGLETEIGVEINGGGGVRRQGWGFGVGDRAGG